MADPLSVTASVVGIVGPALHGVRLLAGDLKQIKDAPESVATLRERISEVERALVTLEKIPDQELEALGVAEDTKATITKCGDSCKQFSTELKRWTRHSTGDSLTLLDRSKIGFWKQQHIKSMEKELQYCQGAITQVVSIATLISSLKGTQLTQAVRDEKERSVSTALEVASTETAALKSRSKEIRVRGADVDDDDEEEVAEYEFASTQVKAEQKSLEMSQKLLQALLAKIQDPNISQVATQVQHDQSTHMHFGRDNHNYGLQMGTNNATLSNLTFGGAGGFHHYHRG